MGDGLVVLGHAHGGHETKPSQKRLLLIDQAERRWREWGLCLREPSVVARLGLRVDRATKGATWPLDAALVIGVDEQEEEERKKEDDNKEKKNEDKKKKKKEIEGEEEVGKHEGTKGKEGRKTTKDIDDIERLCPALSLQMRRRRRRLVRPRPPSTCPLHDEEENQSRMSIYDAQRQITSLLAGSAGFTLEMWVCPFVVHQLDWGGDRYLHRKYLSDLSNRRPILWRTQGPLAFEIGFLTSGHPYVDCRYYQRTNKVRFLFLPSFIHSFFLSFFLSFSLSFFSLYLSLFLYTYLFFIPHFILNFFLPMKTITTTQILAHHCRFFHHAWPRLWSL